MGAQRLIRFVISDADRTLVRQENLMDPHAFSRMMTMLAARGIPLAIASGRSYPALQRLFAPYAAGLLYFPLDGALAVAQGALLCGFPVGTKCAVSLYDKGEISKEECERLLSFCNIPSISFTVNIVGQRIFGDPSVGWLFYAILVASSIALGMIGADKSRSLTFSRISSHTKRQQSLSASCFVRAVEGSARSTLTICAYVVFFSSFVGVLDVVFNALNAPLMLKTLICGSLEMTNGAVACEAFESPPMRGALCALFVGWSGISVHFQMLSICDGKGLRLGRYIVNKLLQGIICSVIVALFFVLK